MPTSPELVEPAQVSSSLATIVTSSHIAQIPHPAERLSKIDSKAPRGVQNGQDVSLPGYSAGLPYLAGVYLGAQEGNAHVRAGHIKRVRVWEKPTQRLFFIGNALLKKEPRRHGKQHCVHHIAQQYLCADGPIKETDVGRMPQDAVNTVRHQHVIVLFGRLNQVIERFAGRGHSRGANSLCSEYETQAQQNHGAGTIPMRKPSQPQSKFDPRCESGRRVGNGMIDQERVGCHLTGIVHGRDKEFQQVKGTQTRKVRAPLP
jgi:hypothetical protein